MSPALRAIAALGLGLPLAALACAAGSSAPARGHGGQGPDAADDPPPTLVDAGADADAAVEPWRPVRDCTPGTDVVYVVSMDGDVFALDLPSKKLTKVGPVRCSPSGTPLSLAIARDGTAILADWYWNDATGKLTGRLSRLDLGDGRCQPLRDDFRDPSRVLHVGFAAGAPGSASAALFVAQQTDVEPAPGLARFDLASHELTPIGPFTGDYVGADSALTGAADGRLFALLVPDMRTSYASAAVAELDPGTGAVKSATRLAPQQWPDAYAITSWGGDLYLFTAFAPSEEPWRNTAVTRFRPADGSTEVVLPDLGILVVGAGTAPCR
jgi:hypothetical protein